VTDNDIRRRLINAVHDIYPSLLGAPRLVDHLLALPGIAIVDTDAVLKKHRSIDTADRYLSECLTCTHCHGKWPCEVVKLLAATNAAEVKP
jgi:hypothetical protein